MGTEIAQRSTQFAGEDRRWLDGGLHGQNTNKDVTLDGSLFPAGTFPDGRVPSGVVLGIVTASKLAGPYDADATDGRQTAVVHLLNTETVRPGARILTAGVRHGVVNRNLLPANSGLDAAAEDDLSQITYQDL